MMSEIRSCLNWNYNFKNHVNKSILTYKFYSTEPNNVQFGFSQSNALVSRDVSSDRRSTPI